MPVVFFDIGDTLATPVFNPDNSLGAFNVFPEARTALESIKQRGLRMGIISNPGNENPENVNLALDRAGLLQFFNEEIIVYGKKDSPAIFISAAEQASVSLAECVFVGENGRERSFALAAGFGGVAPHPSLALSVIDGKSLFYARVKLTKEQLRHWIVSRSLSIVPLQVTGGAQPKIVVIASNEAIEILRSEGVDVETLGQPDAPFTTDLFLVRDDRVAPQGFASSADYSASFLADQGQEDLVVADSPEGVYVAIPADRSIEEIHFPGAQHGHNEKLIPDASLLESLPGQSGFSENLFDSSLEDEVQLSDEQLEALKTIDAGNLRKFHEPYAGLSPLEDGSSVASRHIRHPDNAKVVEALQRQFTAIGGSDVIVSRHRFQHEDLFLHNVVAEFPGTEPESLVLVTAHLDSTAAFTGGPYDPASDPAPGSDDDASGIAAVLAVAEVVAKLHITNQPKRTIRFVLFNAEEHGLVGSKAYARSQAAQQARIDGVFQMDMIGFSGTHQSPPRNYEIHAGFPPSPDVETRSLGLAKIIESVSATVSADLSSPQVFPDPETDNEDPAAGRSDHGPFNERGYAGCVLSEDFFAGPKLNSPDAEPNPNYHKNTDRSIDYNYAADIARVVAAASLVAANL